MIQPIRHVLCIAVAGALAAGCAPLREDAEPGVAGSQTMAVLTSNDTGRYDITLMDMTGNVTQVIEANLQNPGSITYHPGGFFLVATNNQQLTRVDLNGASSQFNQQPMPGVVYRMDVNPITREITVAEEYDVTELDEDGNIINHSTNPGNYCWLDAGAGPDAGGDRALLDVFGPSIATWNSEAGTYSVIASDVGQSTSVLGLDGSGTYYAAGWSDLIWGIDSGGEVRSLANLSDVVGQVWNVQALEQRSANSVYALYEGDQGNGIVEIDSTGRATEILTAGGQQWMDMTIF